eukprot:1819947-Pleurochrysis_carterae.AAC.1
MSANSFCCKVHPRIHVAYSLILFWILATLQPTASCSATLGASTHPVCGLSGHRAVVPFRP